MFSSVMAEQTILEKAAEFVLGTKCEQHLRSAERFSSVSIYAADAGEWDWAFRNDEMTWRALILAQSYCEDEPENLKIAKGYFEEHLTISERLVCSYHTSEARRFTGLAKKALEQSDVNETLFNARWATYYLDEAIERCAFDPEIVNLLIRLRDEAYKLITGLEKWNEDWGDLEWGGS